MGRPTGAAWAPLGLNEDPTPGDPQRVTDEVSHLNSVAATILNQIGALKKIAGDDSDPLIGKYADKIRESAGDLVGKLQKVHDRYSKVASALGGWEPDLVTAQAMSLKALNEAEGPYQQLKLLNGPTISAPQTSPPTPRQQQAAAAHKAAVTKAQGQLNSAISDLHKAVQFRDDRASYWAGKINSASDDSLKDSWWDSFKSWVTQYAGIIKDICTVLEYVATALAIIALFIPGLDIIVILGIAATALALVGRAMLAATGNGSWIDVALDAFALLTFGAGKIVGKLMDSTFETAEGLAKSLRAAKIAESPLGRMASSASRFADALESNGMVKGAAGFLKDIGLGKLGDGLTSGVGKASGLIRSGSTAVMEHVAPSVDKTLAGVSHDIKPAEVALYGGEKESLLMSRNMNALNKVWGADSKFAELNTRFNSLLNVQRGIFGTATGVDAADKSLSGIQWYGKDGEHPLFNGQLTDSWSNIKDSVVTEGGLSTSTVNGIIDVASVVQPETGLPAQAFRFAVGKWG